MSFIQVLAHGQIPDFRIGGTQGASDGGCRSEKRPVSSSILRKEGTQAFILFQMGRPYSLPGGFADNQFHIRGNISCLRVLYDGFGKNAAAVRERAVVPVHSHNPFMRRQGIHLFQMVSDTHVLLIAV